MSTTMSAEKRQQLVQTARAILAGRLPAPVLPMRTEGMLPTIPREEMPPRQRAAEDWLNLQAHYGGHPVATYTTPEGVLAVMAVGFDEIAVLRDGLSSDELRKLMVEFPQTPLDFVLVPPEDRTPDPVGALRINKELVHVGSDPRAAANNPSPVASQSDPAKL